jgi:GTP cyclohydrolase IA
MDPARIEAAVRELLVGIGDDPDRPGIADTPQRVAESYAEFFGGMQVDAVQIVRDGAVPADDGELGELVVVRDIRFRSMCEHHLLPFLGVAHIAYVPGERIIGLGTLAKVVDAVATRPQLQERLGEEIADTIADGLVARGVLVVLDAAHGCVTSRGSRQTASTTVTLAARGTLADPLARAEAVTLLGAPHVGAGIAGGHGADA